MTDEWIKKTWYIYTMGFFFFKGFPEAQMVKNLLLIQEIQIQSTGHIHNGILLSS